MPQDFKIDIVQTNATKRNDLRPELELVELPIDTLVTSNRCVRTPNKKHIERARRSIEELGFIDPPIVGPDNEIIDGHTRVEAARALSLTTIPCIRLSCDDERLIRAARIALNKTQELGTWDQDALALELAYQIEFDIDLTCLGFEAPELDALFDITSGEAEDVDPADEFGKLPDPVEPTISEFGDVWLLGDHRICCGNGRDFETVMSLLGGNGVDLVFTDPPFNVPVNGHVRVSTDKFDEFAEASGEMSKDEFIAFLESVIVVANQVRRSGALYYVFMDWRHAHEMLEAIQSTGFELVNICVWAKLNGGMGSFYRSRHELVFVFRQPGAQHINNIELGKHGRYRTNVWEYAGATGGKSDEIDDFSVHPTVKPVRLVADAILDSTAIGHVVFDPFLGSGTTLIAAERTKRHCFGIEIAPVYVDVAIRRWEEMSGQKAIHQATGQTFSERSAGAAAGMANTGTPSPVSEDF